MRSDFLISSKNKCFGRIFNEFLKIIFAIYILSNGNPVIAEPVSNHQKDELQQSTRTLPKFRYSYHVGDLDSGEHGHRVHHRTGSNTEGQYYVRLNDGASSQNVEYFTDQFGYHPKVVYSNNGDSASSRAKITFGQEYPSNDHFQKTGDIKDTNNNSSPQPTSPAAAVELKTIMKFSDGLPSAKSLPMENSDIVIGTTPTSSSNGPAFPPPELNEISHEFVGRMIEAAGISAGLFNPSRLIRPIIVTESTANFSRKSDDDAFNTTSVDAVPPSVIHDTLQSPSSPRSTDSSVEVLIEPQSMEEHAIITTTMDIAKSQSPPSLPLSPIAYLPDVDNHLHETTNPARSTVNTVITPQQTAQLPPQQFHYPQNTYFVPPIIPTHALGYSSYFPRQIVTPYPQLYSHQPYTYNYIPFPNMFHAPPTPNTIPLNFNFESPPRHPAQAVPPAPQYTTSNSSQTDQPQPPIETTDRKQIKYRSIGGAGYQQSQPQLLHRRPSPSGVPPGPVSNPAPHAFNVPPAHLIPYVKQTTNFPYNYQQALNLKQRSMNTDSPLLPQSISYNIKYFPRENGAKSASAAPSTNQKPSSAPFKPSHPLWDSIYPPSHMYYVPQYVFDKVPAGLDRTARDSTASGGKRNQRYLRKLYVEYGGFKPPMIPSTLLEPEDEKSLIGEKHLVAEERFSSGGVPVEQATLEKRISSEAALVTASSPAPSSQSTSSSSSSSSP